MANISAEISLAFNYTKFRVSETEGINFLGDAVVSDYVVQFTNTHTSEYKHCKQSSGRIVHDGTIRLSSMASFSTHFVFSMHSPKHDSQGEGIAFFLSSEGTAYYMRSGGLFGGDVEGCFRLCRDDVDKLPNIFAVVFSSVRDSVGILAHSSSNGCSWKHNSVSPLNNGTLWDAWIDYNSPKLRVYLSSGCPGLKSLQNCIFSDHVQFSQYVRGNVSIGFSSAVVKSTETHNIFSWSFNSTLYSENTFVVNNSSPNDKNNTSVNGQNNPVEVSSKEKGRKQLSKSKKRCITVVSCIVAFIAGALCSYFTFLRRNRAKSMRGQNLACMDLEKLLYHIPQRFKLDDLVAGTNNFSEALKLGQGGFGGVYKCNFPQNNEIVAVKRISEGSKQGIKEFISEVSIVSRLRHRNIVQLLGWCHERDQFLLVYEYMSNQSLDRHIFTRGGGEEPKVLKWSMRYKIATEIASALLYLHEEWDECVVHRDVKSSNVLLDSNFTAKIGDFGLGRMLRHECLAQTTRAAGTLGYLAPECVARGKIGPESDVYSFGVMALEIASGKQAIDASLVEFDMRLVAWAWDLYSRGRLLEGEDVRLNGVFEKEEMERLMVVGLWCSHSDATSRPKMRQVVRLLNFEIAVPILPITMPISAYAHNSITVGPSNPVQSMTTLSPR